ncbi:MAG: hypothetical protein J6R04_00850, partial [Clostridia bacterium]|nr:hypothetical protein [Clostridia bacterium]
QLLCVLGALLASLGANSLRKARLEIFVQQRFSVLFGTASKTSWAGLLCPTLGKLAARITKMGELG